MKKILILILIFTFSSSTVNAKEKITASEFLDLCTAERETLRTFCKGWFAGIIMQANFTKRMYTDLKTSGVTYPNSPIPFICFENEVRAEQLVNIFSKYLNDHPEEEHLAYAYIVYSSIVPHFNCKEYIEELERD